MEGDSLEGTDGQPFVVVDGVELGLPTAGMGGSIAGSVGELVISRQRLDFVAVPLLDVTQPGIHTNAHAIQDDTWIYVRCGRRWLEVSSSQLMACSNSVEVGSVGGGWTESSGVGSFSANGFRRF